MRGRKVWIALAVLASAGAALMAWTASIPDEPPLRFWLRTPPVDSREMRDRVVEAPRLDMVDGSPVNPNWFAHIYGIDGPAAAPGSSPLFGWSRVEWTFAPVHPTATLARPEESSVLHRIRGWLGLRSEQRSWTISQVSGWGDAPPHWTLWVRIPTTPFPSSPPDPSLAGTWEGADTRGGAYANFELRADGTAVDRRYADAADAERGRRWTVVDDCILISTRNGATVDAYAFGVLTPDRRTLLRPHGPPLRKR